MGVVKQFTGFDNENFQVGYLDSKGWKEDVQSAADGDFKEIVCNEVPTYTDDSNKVEVKRIGVVKRNAVQYIGAGKGTLNIVQLLVRNYVNVYPGLLEATMGEVVYPREVTGEAVQSVNIEVISDYILFANDTNDWLRYTDGKKPALVAIYDLVTGKIIDMAVIFKIVGDAAHCIGKLSDDLDKTGSTLYKVKSLAWIDVDTPPSLLKDFLARRASGYDYNNDPEFDGIYDGAKLIKFINALGSATLNLPIQEQGTIEYEFMSDDIRYIDPTPELLPATITVSDITTAGETVNIALVGKAGTTDSLTALTGLDNPSTAITIAAAINGQFGLVAVANGDNVEITSTSKSFVEVYVASTDGNYVTTYNETDEWILGNNINSINTPNCEIDTEQSGTTLEQKTVAITLGSALVGGALGRLYVNGQKFEYLIQNGDVLVDLVDGICGEWTDSEVESRFTVMNVSDDIQVTATDPAEKLAIEFEIIDPTGTIGDTHTITENALSTAAEYSDEAPFFKLSNIMIGEAGVNMYGFCEVANLTINFERTIEDIKSICGTNGRKGWNNTNYSLSVEVETTDIDAQRVYDKFAKYRGNETFALVGTDIDSGFAIGFPKCKIEDFEPMEINGLQGHKFTINVNFDPNVKPLLALMQEV